MTSHHVLVFLLLLAALGATATLREVNTPDAHCDPPAAPPGPAADDAPYLIVLGIAQDAGYPHAGCAKACCLPAWNDQRKRRFPCCVAVVDPATKQRWIFDCTPNFPEQLNDLDRAAPPKARPGIDGIFLTHAHIGHYTGLMHLGREVMGTKGVPVHVMPRMAEFLRKNGPWSQLVDLGNIKLTPLADGQTVKLNDRITVTPLLVPHRGEYSETVGFRIQGPNRSVLYLPDIDRWEDWTTKIEDVLKTVDRAYLDGTFYDDKELPGRNLAEVPHPLITTSMKRFAPLPKAERDKVHFLHLNHTNPALDPASKAAEAIRNAGHHIAEQGGRFGL
jgi:pyrroloquinoline quinone biosynthesis protein B